MPLRRLHGRLHVPQRFIGFVRPEEVTSTSEDSTCRICWLGRDANEGGELLSPCRCSGSVKFIHRRCLGNWQRTQRSQGAFRKSYRCDICKERYRVRRAPFSGPKMPIGGRLPTFDEFKEVFFGILGSPVWQVGIDVWKAVILANGLMHASAFGAVGLNKGLMFASKSALVYYRLMAQYGPELLVAAAAFPIVKVPTLLLTFGGGAIVGIEMLAAVLLGWYGGAMYGFVYGSMQILRASVSIASDLGGKGMGRVIAIAGVGLRGFLEFCSSVYKRTVCVR